MKRDNNTADGADLNNPLDNWRVHQSWRPLALDKERVQRLAQLVLCRHNERSRVREHSSAHISCMSCMGQRHGRVQTEQRERSGRDDGRPGHSADTPCG